MTHPEWLALAWRDVGIREKKGALNSKMVMGYYRDVGADWVKGDDVAWCAAFVGSCLVRSGFRSTGSLLARSYLKWGRTLKSPKSGAVAVFSRGANKALGHVGFYVGQDARSVFILGGNQSDSVSIAAYSKSRLLGYRWPNMVAEVGGGVDDAQFETALAHVLEFEGGWTNDPQDPGGPTNKGITLEVYAENKGVKLSTRNRRGLMGELRQIDDAHVRDIYFRRYWQRASCPDFEAGVAFIHFDAAVNHGPTRAIKMLQQTVGVNADGEVGPVTRQAVIHGNQAEIVGSYADIRDRFYRSLSHFPRFGRGWLRRLRAAEMRSMALVKKFSRKPGAVNRSKKDQSDMSKEPKWWAQSMTIWGAIITALTTVLPVVAPLMGYDITADMVSQFGGQVSRLIQSMGGVIGIVMTIFGRLRTTAPLERRRMSFDF